MPSSSTPAAAIATPRARRHRAIDPAQLKTLATAFLAALPAGLLGYHLVEDARIAAVFAMLVAITLLSLLTEPAGRRR